MVEVLVALSLVAVLGTTALLLLESTRRVSDDVAREPKNLSRSVIAPLRLELDHLLPDPPLESLPTFTLENDGRLLRFTTRLPDEAGRLRAVELAYISTPDGAFRVHRPLHHAHGVTNRLDTAGRPPRFAAERDGDWQSTWPPEEPQTSGPPSRLRLTLPGAGDDLSHTLFIPASLRVSGREENTADEN